MGIDAVICAKLKRKTNVAEYDDIPFLITPIEKSEKKYYPKGATHYADEFLGRYYSPSYERGSWPRICGVLMELYSHPYVEKVWYFGDCKEAKDIVEFTREDIIRYSKHYMNNYKVY